jgi:hypothetical protein
MSEASQTLPLPATRLSGETIRAHNSFKVYCALGPTRSLQKTSQKLAKNLTTLKEWSSKYCWVERSATYDAEQAEVERLAAAQAILERARLREQRRDELCESLWHKAKAIERKLDEMLRFPVHSKRTLQNPDGTGTIVLVPAKWDFGTAARLATTLKELAAFSCGVPPTITGHSGSDGGELPVPASEGLVIPPVVIRIVHQDASGKPVPQPAPGMPPTPVSSASPPVKDGFVFERSK